MREMKGATIMPERITLGSNVELASTDGLLGKPNAIRVSAIRPKATKLRIVREHKGADKPRKKPAGPS